MKIIKRVSLVLVCLILFTFIPGISHADNDDKKNDDGIGGKLLTPICDLIVFLGDAGMNILHKSAISQGETLISVDMVNGTLRTILTVLVGIVAAVAAVALVCATAGAAAALLGPVLASVGVSIGTLSAGACLTAALIGGGLGAAYFYNADFFPDTLYFPIYTITPEKIFSNDIALFDIDFFNPSGEEIEIEKEDGTKQKSWGTVVTLPDGTDVTVESTAYKLQSTIATWYKNLRDISIVALLSILVYIGIRILISSTSNDKAKYKQMIMDWVVALCLLFVMQYIMSFANIIADKITDLVKTANNDKYLELVVQYDEKITKNLANYMAGSDATDDEKEQMKKKLEEGEDAIVKTLGSGDKVIIWNTDLMGYARFEAQMAKAGNVNYAGFSVVYMVLVFYTIFFSFTYLKRVVYMAFLTLVAPLVALTYPIDKINDGKAQAFDRWIKEYIFNLLIQPLHLLLFTILITSVFELASQNIIYALVALGFMMPAEKLMRKFFGFEKADTPGMLGGAAGAAMVMSGMNKLLSKGQKGGKDSSSKNDNSSSEKDHKIRMNDSDADKVLADGKDDDSTPVMNYDRDASLQAHIQNNEAAMKKYQEEGNMEEVAKAQERIDKAREELDSRENSGASAQEDNKQFTEDRIAERAKQKMDDFKLSPQYLYTKDVAKKVLKPGKKVAGYVGRGINRGINRAGNTRIIKGIRNSRTWAGMKGAGQKWTEGMGNKLSNKIRNMHPIKSGIKMAGGAALGATAAGIGLAAGIASGDPSKAFQYSAAGALGGYKFGSGTANRAINTLSVEGTKEAYEKAFYGEEEYKQREIDKRVRMAKKDLELKTLLEEKLKDKDKAKQFMDKSLDYYVSNGLEDSNGLVAAAKMEDQGEKPERILTYAKTEEQYAKNKDTNHLGKKEDKELNDTLLMRAQQNKYVKNDEEAQKIANSWRAGLNTFTRFKNED